MTAGGGRQKPGGVADSEEELLCALDWDRKDEAAIAFQALRAEPPLVHHTQKSALQEAERQSGGCAGTGYRRGKLTSLFMGVSQERTMMFLLSSETSSERELAFAAAAERQVVRKQTGLG